MQINIYVNQYMQIELKTELDSKLRLDVILSY